MCQQASGSTVTAGPPLCLHRKDLQVDCSLPAYPGGTAAMTKMVKTPDYVLDRYY